MSQLPIDWLAEFGKRLEQHRYAEALAVLADPLSTGTASTREPALKCLWQTFHKHRCYVEILDLVSVCLDRCPEDAGLLEVASISHAYLAEMEPARALFDRLLAAVTTPRQFFKVIRLVPKLHSGEARFLALRRVQARLEIVVPVPTRSVHALSAHAALRLALGDAEGFESMVDSAPARLPVDRSLGRLKRMADRGRIFRTMAGLVPRIFCIGLSKTGTTSLHGALEQLGFLSAHWTNPLTGNLLGDQDIPYLDAFSDTPISYRFEELYYAYPKALFIYTFREPMSWQRSMLKHFATMQRDRAGLDFAGLVAAHHAQRDGMFGFERYKIHGGLYFNYASLADAHATFDRRVRHFFADKPVGRFLALDIVGGQGWRELCAFLGAPIPGEPFPWQYKTRFSPSSAQVTAGVPPKSVQTSALNPTKGPKIDDQGIDARINTLIPRLWPVVTTKPLVRIGRSGDGGYLVPDDLDGIGACFSPGVGNQSTFEHDLLNRYGIRSYRADATVAAPAPHASIARFDPLNLSAVATATTMTLEAWVVSTKEGLSQQDLLLQMDIEGAEYAVLDVCPVELLRRFRMIALEFHGVGQWREPDQFAIVERIFEKLLANFWVVHTHPDNCCGTLDLAGVESPRVFEMTLLRKGRGQVLGYVTALPNPLDAPITPRKPDFALPGGWYWPTPQSQPNPPPPPSVKLARNAILCRAPSGLTDKLAGIARMIPYATRTGRMLFVDTAFASSKFDDKLSNYFQSRVDWLVLDIDALSPYLDLVSVYPDTLQGRLSNYSARYIRDIQRNVDAHSGAVVTFSLKADYPQSVLVHHQASGGDNAIEALAMLTLVPELRSILEGRLNILGPDFSALHIRNTDYQTDFQPYLNDIARTTQGAVFVATDSQAAIESCKQVFGPDRVVSFVSFAPVNQPLHYQRFPPAQRRQRNIDAILDLLLLGYSQYLHCFRLKPGHGVVLSGYSRLALQLHEQPELLASITGLAIGADERGRRIWGDVRGMSR